MDLELYIKMLQFIDKVSNEYVINEPKFKASDSDNHLKALKYSLFNHYFYLEWENSEMRISDEDALNLLQKYFGFMQ